MSLVFIIICPKKKSALNVTSDGLANVILIQIWTDDATNLKSLPNNDFLTLLDLMWINIVPNSTFLFVDVRFRLEMSINAKDDFSIKNMVSLKFNRKNRRPFTYSYLKEASHFQCQFSHTEISHFQCQFFKRNPFNFRISFPLSVNFFLTGY